MSNQASCVVLFVSVTLALLIVVTSCVGMMVPDFYDRETIDWQLQTIGQDRINLFVVVPALIVTALLVWKRNAHGYLLWAGVIAYTVYTFIIYGFSVHFNRLFVVYCVILGVSFYALAWVLFTQVKRYRVTNTGSKAVRRATGIFFIIIAVLFYALWLADILPAVLQGVVPSQLTETGLMTNPVHVIDLSVFLPAIFITGFLLLRRKQGASLAAIMLLAFFIIMDTTIGWLAFMMRQERLAPGISVTIAMAVLCLLSTFLLVLNSKHVKINTQ